MLIRRDRRGTVRWQQKCRGSDAGWKWIGHTGRLNECTYVDCDLFCSGVLFLGCFLMSTATFVLATNSVIVMVISYKLIIEYCNHMNLSAFYLVLDGGGYGS